MTRIIAHRGLTRGGASAQFPNSKEAVDRAVLDSFDVEIDIRYTMNGFWLGHDHPEYEVTEDNINTWAEKVKIYVHCKTMRTLEEILHQSLHVNVIPFFHDVDDCILLKDNTIWVHPKSVIQQNFVSRRTQSNSILVLPTLRDFSMLTYEFVSSFKGICTDHPIELKSNLEWQENSRSIGVASEEY